MTTDRTTGPLTGRRTPVKPSDEWQVMLARKDLLAVRTALSTALFLCRDLAENEVLNKLTQSNCRSLCERIESLRPRVALLAADLTPAST